MIARSAARAWLVTCSACVCAALLLLGACSDTEARTQVMLEIDADAAVRVRLETLRILIDVSDDEGESWEKRLTKTYDADDVGGWRKFEWPAQLGLVPAGDNADRSFAVRAQALDADGDLYVWQQAVARFTRGHTTLLAMSLVDECTVAALECGNAGCVGTAGCKTCRAGDCVDVELLASLPDYDPDASGSLFDGSVLVDTDAGPIDGGKDGGPDARIDAGNTEPPPDTGPPTDAGDAQIDADIPDADAGDSATPAPFTVVESTPSVAAPVLDDTRGGLSVTFSAPVDEATITASRFKVVHGGAPVSGVIATSERGATFTPDKPWVLAGAYTLSLNASIEDATGRPLQTFELGFSIRDGVWTRLAVFDAIADPVLALARDGHGVLQWPRLLQTGGREIMVSLYTPGAPWSSPVQLSPVGDSASVAAINDRHHAVAVWSGISAGQTASVYTGTDWTTGASVSPGSFPDVFLSEGDELFFVASDAMNNNALDGYRFTLGTATPPTEIPLAPTTFYNTSAQLALVGSTAALMWQHHDTGTGISSVNVGTFATLDTPQISTPGSDASFPQVAFNAAQTSATAVWLEAASATPTLTRVWAAQLFTTGTWSAPVVVSQGTAAALRPVVAVDDQGRALAAWTQGGAIVGARFEPAIGWSTPAPISAAGAVGNETPRIALAPNGNGVAVWAQDSPGMILNEIWAARFVAGRGWQASSRARISDIEAGASDMPSLAIDGAGRALVGWYQGTKVWVARFE